MKYRNVAIWFFLVETEDQNGEKLIPFFREKTLVAKLATKAKTLVAKRKI